jgi:hypothetical protein
MDGIKALAERGKDYPEVRKKIQIEMGKFSNTGAPPWFGNAEFHASHRRALLYKNREWYSQFGWAELPDVPNEDGKLNYYWPIR